MSIAMAMLYGIEPNEVGGLSGLQRRILWNSYASSEGCTRKLSGRVVNAATAFPYYTKLPATVPSSVSELRFPDDDHYKRVRRQRIGIAGALASALPQGMLISLDVIKSNMQAKPTKYQTMSSTVRSLLATRRSGALSRGLTPTLMGYSLHGFVKFRAFDCVQEFCHKRLGSRMAEKHERMIRCVSIASAELVAVIPLAPLAMVKVKMETSAAGSWQVGLIPALKKMYTNRAKTGFPFRPVFALWLRQIPLSVTQLYLFDSLRSKVSTYASAEQRKRWGFGIMVLCGFGVGVICTPLSQPADYVLSRFALSSNRGKTGLRIICEDGLRNALLRGLAPRYVMVGMMTALQFSIYENSFTIMKLGK